MNQKSNKSKCEYAITMEIGLHRRNLMSVEFQCLYFDIEVDTE